MDITALLGWTALPLLMSDIHFGHIIKVTVILGRIIALHNQLHVSPFADSFDKEATALECALDCLQGLIAQNPNGYKLDNPYRVWLFILLQTCRTLLHHPLDQEKQSSFRAASGKVSGSIGFERCEEASRALFQITRQLQNPTSESLMNPFIVASFFIGASILCISRACGDSFRGAENVRSLIEAVDVIGSRYHGISMKYRRAIMRNLTRDEKDLESMRIGSGNYLDVYCD